MLELRLRSGQIVTFDGRIVEVFASNGGGGRRLHIAKLDPTQAFERDGSSTVALAGDGLQLHFRAEEVAARDRLLNAIVDARRADARVGG
jgi:hypothetical protein